MFVAVELAGKMMKTGPPAACASTAWQTRPCPTEIAPDIHKQVVKHQVEAIWQQHLQHYMATTFTTFLHSSHCSFHTLHLREDILLLTFSQNTSNS